MPNAEILKEIFSAFTFIGFICFILRKTTRTKQFKKVNKFKRMIIMPARKQKIQTKKVCGKQSTSGYLEACWDEVQKI